VPLRFAVLLEDSDGNRERLFDWQPTFFSRMLGSQAFDLKLSGEAEFLRLRFQAWGEGPAARWRNLSLARLNDTPEEFVNTPSASPSPAPRVVVLYVLDALRADHLGHLGGDSSAAPYLDRLARQGITFRNHFSVAPNTLPSTKALFTGKTPLTEGTSPLARDHPQTIAEVFNEAGYSTGLFSGNTHFAPAFGLRRGFQYVAEETLFQEYEDLPGAYSDNAERVHRAALEWLDEIGREEKMFLYLHTIHPHNPYDPPEPFLSRFAGGIQSALTGSTSTLLSIKHGRIEPSLDDKAKIEALYDGGLAYNDDHIARFLEELTGRYAPSEILLVITSDHGEELFEHGSVLHGYTLYEDQLRIPLIFWWPGRLPPREVDQLTATPDLHETLRQLVGAPPSGMDGGRSLWPTLLGKQLAAADQLPRFAAASSLAGGIFMARSERYKVIYAPRTGIDWGMGEAVGRTRDVEYVLDLKADPAEMVNLAGTAPLEAAWLRSQLFAWFERGKLQETGSEALEIDDKTRAELEALGYLQ
jgi:arylsulfatase A-like enzyme